MKKLVILSVITLLFSSSLSFANSLQSLDEEQIKDFQDNTISTVPLITLYGKLINNTLTSYLGADGKIIGRLSSKLNNGPQVDRGNWTVKNGTLCILWQHWSQNIPTCLYVYELDNSLVFVNAENNNFETMVLKDNIQSGNQFQTQN